MDSDIDDIRHIRIDKEYEPPEWKKPITKKKEYNWLYHSRRRRELKEAEQK